mgnify:CR=1 FL=1
MKIIKRISLIVLLLLLVSGIGGYFYFKNMWAAPPNELQVSKGAIALKCTWQASAFSKREALLLPIKLPDIDRTLYMQFDFGSPYSMLYYKTAKSIQKRYPNFKVKRNPEDRKHAYEVNFSLGNLIVKAPKMRLRNYGKAINWKNPAKIIIIGTIGTDFLERKQVIVDFKNSLVNVFDQLPDDQQNKLQMIDCSFDERRIYLSGMLDNDDKKFMYDSGCSAYSLITDANTWNKLKIPNTKPIIHQGNSWGRKLQVLTNPSKYQIDFGKVQVPLRSITHVKGAHWTQKIMMRLSGMGGMIGNHIFKENTIYIDAKNEKFAIVM